MRKYTTITTISVIITALLVGGAVYLFQEQRLQERQQQIEQLQQQITELKEEIEKQGEEDSGSEVDTSEWKTYRNEELGLMFKYPPKKFNLLQEESGRLQMESIEKSSDGVGRMFVMTVRVEDRKEVTDMTREINSLEKNMGLAKLWERFGKNNVKASFYGNPPRGTTRVWIASPDKSPEGVNFSFDISTLDYPAYGGTHQYRNTAKQILSTFRFVE